MTMEQELSAAINKLQETALRVKKERDLLLTLICHIYRELDDRYDVDRPIDGPPKEYPFNGCGQMMAELRKAAESCGAKL